MIRVGAAPSYNTDVDRGSLTRVWIPALLAVILLDMLATALPVPHDLRFWLGFALVILGFSGVLAARYTLGRSFSIRAKATALVTSGIYSRIRNPIYLSGFIVLAGMILVVRLPILGLVAIILIPVQIFRARNEARVLEARFGDEYRRYRDRTWF
jgi:protein-S-isoprenylcysteine O-methyltransferase Ste14